MKKYITQAVIGLLLVAGPAFAYNSGDLPAGANVVGQLITTVANKLSVFASTTSAELASVISNETGTGSLVFANAPVIINPTISGTITGNIVGNASTATALQTARTINGVSFDGTGNIVVASAAGTLNGTTLASNVVTSSLTSVGTLGTLTVTAPITGSVTGNAGTATILATARNINGVAFDGSGNITVTAAASTLTGTTLASNVVSSSLTSVGTLSGLTVTAPISGSVTGNAATATTLATPRNINGVAFDGSAPITVTAAAGTLSGSTLASGVTASSLTSVGTIATGTWQATPLADAYISSAATWNAKQASLPAGTTTTVLHGNASGSPTYGSITVADMGAILGNSLTSAGGVINTTTPIDDQSTLPNYTIAVGDMGGMVKRSATVAMNDQLPQAGSQGFGSQATFKLCNYGTFPDLLSPQSGSTSLILGSPTSTTTLNTQPGQCSSLTSDGTNWNYDGGAAITRTPQTLTAASYFDYDPTVPSTRPSDGFGSTQLAISTAYNNDFIFGAFRAATASPTAGAGWTQISGANNLLTEYQVVTTPQTNLSVTSTTGATTMKSMFADAITGVSPALDGSVHATASSGTSITATLTTTQAGLVIVVTEVNTAGTGQNPVSSVTASGLTFTKRLAFPVGISHNTSLEEWVAPSSGALSSKVITVNFATTNFVAVDAFGVSGAELAFAPNVAASTSFQMPLVHASCPCIVGNPVNLAANVGKNVNFEVDQSATGSDTVTWGSVFKFAGGTAPVLSTAASAQDYFSGYVRDSTHVIVSNGVFNAQ